MKIFNTVEEQSSTHPFEMLSHNPQASKSLSMFSRLSLISSVISKALISGSSRKKQTQDDQRNEEKCVFQYTTVPFTIQGRGLGSKLMKFHTYLFCC